MASRSIFRRRSANAKSINAVHGAVSPYAGVRLPVDQGYLVHRKRWNTSRVCCGFGRQTDPTETQVPAKTVLVCGRSRAAHSPLIARTRFDDIMIAARCHVPIAAASAQADTTERSQEVFGGLVAEGRYHRKTHRLPFRMLVSSAPFGGKLNQLQPRVDSA